MAKRALLVGCNYPGTQAELHGCVNDVFAMRSLLTDLYGFEEGSFTVLIDTDSSYEQPTGRNIKAKLREVVAASQPGDVLFLHFSGHGTQVPGDREEEADMKDEAICPTDMNLILDDDLRAILQELNDEVFFTFVSDCCHSGGMLDHAAIQISGPKDGSSVPQMDMNAVLSSFGLKGRSKGKQEIKNRSLPVEDLMSMLSEKLGGNVELGNLRGALGRLFGGDASGKIQMYLQVASQVASMLQQSQGGGNQSKVGCLVGIISMITSMLGKQNSGGAQQDAGISVPPPGGKPPTAEQLAADKGILITGCQSNETSADACPGGDKSKAFGALTNAVVTTARAHDKQYPGEPLPYRNLVLSVRDMLSKGGYSQNPCLEGSDKNADASFITGSA